MTIAADVRSAAVRRKGRKVRKAVEGPAAAKGETRRARAWAGIARDNARLRA